MHEIIHRSLTPGEARCLHLELKKTPNILGYTVRELERLSDVHAAEVDHVFAGVCFSVDLTLGWTEIAALYVLPDFRGRGIGGDLFRAAWERTQARRRHVYILSRNPQVIEWMQDLGMTVNGDLWRAPLAVHWFLSRYMASRYRFAEGLRKCREIARCPPLRHGIKRYTPPGAH